MRNSIFRRGLVLGILILFIVVSMTVCNVSCQNPFLTIYVDSDNTVGPWNGTSRYPFQHIQEGINVVGENGTVYVSNGIYIENITITKSIRLIGENKGTTIIDGETNGIVVYISATDVNMSGFTIRNSRIGIVISNSSNSWITDNTIRNNSIYGVSLLNSSQHNYIFKNNFLCNSVHAYDSGINFWDAGYPAGGNYWDDYRGEDSTNDGSGDTVYHIYGGTNSDQYPLIIPLTLFPSAHFSFAPSNPTTQDSVQFTDYSIDSDGSVVSWYWTFGDNTSATEQYPTHRYRNDGLYHVILTVTDDYGVTNKLMQQILVTNVQPNASFVYSPMNPTDLQTIVFNDTSFDNDGTVVSWMWDFGDNNTSSLRNTTHQYRDNGTYQITFNITDDDGTISQIVQQIQILNTAPFARFSYESMTPRTHDTIQFTDTSSDGDGTIVSWLWDFGDGITSTIRSPSHSYTTADDYIVSLVVIDNDGASSTESISILIYSTSSTTVGNQFNFIIYIVYIMFFVIMLGIVVLVMKKYGRY